jgi:hypothetical protein
MGFKKAVAYGIKKQKQEIASLVASGYTEAEAYEIVDTQSTNEFYRNSLVESEADDYE